MSAKEQSTQGYVKTNIQDHIGTIEFYHPQGNSLPAYLLEGLADAITVAGNNNEARVIILRSAGDRAFCAGASFSELAAIETVEQGLRFFSGFAKVINAMRRVPKFIIARIQGKCVGGGVGLAAAADYAIATHKAEIKLSELAIGIGPFVIGPAVERKIGVTAFARLSMNATEWHNAAWALRKGLFTELYADTEEADAAVSKLGGTLAQYNPGAMAEIKKMFWQGTENWDELLYERAAISGRLALSSFTKLAIAEFKKNQ